MLELYDQFDSNHLNFFEALFIVILQCWNFIRLGFLIFNQSSFLFWNDSKDKNHCFFLKWLSWASQLIEFELILFSRKNHLKNISSEIFPILTKKKILNYPTEKKCWEKKIQIFIVLSIFPYGVKKSKIFISYFLKQKKNPRNTTPYRLNNNQFYRILNSQSPENIIWLYELKYIDLIESNARHTFDRCSDRMNERYYAQLKKKIKTTIINWAFEQSCTHHT